MSGDWDDFAAALADHADAIRRRLAEQDVQTNEVQRCIALLPAFLTIAREVGLPLELLELGPSAGLNLLVDRYRFRYAAGSWGPESARLELRAEERGGTVPADLLATELVVRRRRGIDLAPVDATTDAGYLLLRSFLWPGLEDRVRRLDDAIATLRDEAVPPELIRGDYVELLPALLAERPHDAVTVVFQTRVDGLPATRRGRAAACLARSGRRRRPTARLGLDAPLRRARGDDGGCVRARATRLARPVASRGTRRLPRQLAGLAAVRLSAR